MKLKSKIVLTSLATAAASSLAPQTDAPAPHAANEVSEQLDVSTLVNAIELTRFIDDGGTGHGDQSFGNGGV